MSLVQLKLVKNVVNIPFDETSHLNLIKQKLKAKFVKVKW